MSSISADGDIVAADDEGLLDIFAIVVLVAIPGCCMARDSNYLAC